MITLKAPMQNAVVSLQTAYQKTFVLDEDRRAKMDGNLTFCWYDLKMEGTDQTPPLPVSFSWEDADGDELAKDASYYLLVSEKADMSKPWVYITTSPSHDVYNLKIGTKYFWCVQKSGRRSEVFSFETEAILPRCLKIDRLTNVRDIGGYAVTEGRIRQGLVFRGSEFETHLHLTAEGAEEIRRLGIRTELDMRGEARERVERTTGEALGLKRVFVPSAPYEEVFGKDQRRTLKTFYRTFADPKNYPIYFHCWGGADRTGTFAFVLGAYLGMRYEDLIYEYEFTSLSVVGTRSRNYKNFVEFLRLFSALDGNTLQEKAKTFLTERAGLTEKQLSAIYDLLVERAEV